MTYTLKISHTLSETSQSQKEKCITLTATFRGRREDGGGCPRLGDEGMGTCLMGRASVLREEKTLADWWHSHVNVLNTAEPHT